MIECLRQGLIQGKIFVVFLRARVLDIVDIVCVDPMCFRSVLFFRIDVISGVGVFLLCCIFPSIRRYRLAALSQADAGSKLVRMR